MPWPRATQREALRCTPRRLGRIRAPGGVRKRRGPPPLADTMAGTIEPLVFVGGTSEPGGLHVHTADVAMAVAAAGHPVRILCPSIDYFSEMLQGTRVGVEILPQRDARESALRYWQRHLAPYRGARVILCRGKLGEGPLNDLPALRLAGCRLYTLEHRDADRPWSYPRGPRLHGLVMRVCVHRTLVVSDAIASTCLHLLRLPHRKVVTCLNWVDPTFRRVGMAERRAAKRALGFAEDEVVIGYHGRLAPEKRLEALVDAFPANPGVRLAIVGDGWKRREIEQRVASRGLNDRVRFTGWYPDPVVAVSAFDIAVLPSLFEGFPLGLMEAMATGCACLAHPMPSALTLIRDGESGVLADLSDPSCFAEALARLLRMPAAQRSAIGAAAAIRIARDFSRERRLPAVLRALGVRSPEAAAAALPVRPRALVFGKPAP